MSSSRLLCSLIVLLCGLPSASAVRGASPDFPEPPPSGEFLLDEVGALGDPGPAGLRELSQELLKDRGTAVFFVVLKSIAGHGALSSEGWSVSTYARALFMEWTLAFDAPGGNPRASATGDEAPARGGGPEGAAGEGGAAGAPSPAGTERRGNLRSAFARNGILVVVSTDDQRVAIETGHHWRERSESFRRAARLMGIHLAAGDESRAVTEGAAAVRKLVLGQHVSLPWDYVGAVLYGLVGLAALLTVVSYLRKGAASGARKFWVTVFSALGSALAFLLRRGVEVGASLSGGGEEPGEKGRIVVGRW